MATPGQAEGARRTRAFLQPLPIRPGRTGARMPDGGGKRAVALAGFLLVKTTTVGENPTRRPIKRVGEGGREKWVWEE